VQDRKKEKKLKSLLPLKIVHEFSSALAQAGLPDGLFSSPKIPIWVNFGGT
jgi:hypothetical protein